MNEEDIEGKALESFNQILKEKFPNDLIFYKWMLLGEIEHRKYLERKITNDAELEDALEEYRQKETLDALEKGEKVSLDQNFQDELEANRQLILMRVGDNAKKILSKTQYVPWTMWLQDKPVKEIAKSLGNDITGVYKIIKRDKLRINAVIDDEMSKKTSTLKKEFSRL